MRVFVIGYVLKYLVCKINHSLLIYFNPSIYCMPGQQLKISFGDINEKNINILRKVNFSVFPVKYSTQFYLKVAMEYAKLSKYCFFNDMVIGAYTVRIEDYK